MFISLAVLLSIPTLELDDPPASVAGQAVIAGTDRPAARVTLRFLDDRHEPNIRVVTDDEGRFLWPSPRGDQGSRKNGHNGPICEVDAQDSDRWNIDLIGAFPLFEVNESLRKRLTNELAKPTDVTWRGDGPAAVLRVACPPTGEVEVVVRGPRYELLPGRVVRVSLPLSPYDLQGQGFVRFTGRTDSNGSFRIRQFERTGRFQVAVPEVGFGSTPSFEVKEGKIARIETSPLARFGTIDGQLVPELRAPGIVVGLDDRALPESVCDDQGKFHLGDIPPGHHRLRVNRKSGDVMAEIVDVWVAPGGRVEGVVIGRYVSPRRSSSPQTGTGYLRMQYGPDGKPLEVVWAEGTIRDSAGKGVAGASVFGRTSLDGFTRSYEDVRQSTSDDFGHYVLRGPLQRFTEPLLIVARMPGRPPAIVTAPARSFNEGRPPQADLTFADRGGSATVLILRDGKPLADASVSLEVDGPAMALLPLAYRSVIAVSRRSGFNSVVRPTVRTGDDGVARFPDLFPGLYKILANDAPAPDAIGKARRFPQGGPRYATIQGVGVALGQETRTTVILLPNFPSVKFQVIRPDGRPVTNQNVSFQFGSGGNAGSGSMMKLDEHGFGQNPFLNTAGLWTTIVRFADQPVNSSPVLEEPYYEAEILLPCSAARRIEDPIRLVGVRRERGSIRVRLLDTAGRPARGVVSALGTMNQVEQAGSTDANGEVRLVGVSGGTYRFDAVLDGPAPPWWSTSRHAPSEEELRGRVAYVPEVRATVEAGREAVIELQAKGVGYVRGTLYPAPGRKAADYYVIAMTDHRGLDSQLWIDPQSGQYILGPVKAGPNRIRSRLLTEDGSFHDSNDCQLVIKAGEVASVDLRPAELEPDPAKADRQAEGMASQFPWIGIRPNDTPVTVYFPDETTPAFGAQALLYLPGYLRPVGSSLGDQGGRLHWGTIDDSTGDLSAEADVSVERPTIVVSQPGRHGALILPFEPGKATRVVLPAELNARGTVTVGGRSAAGRLGRLRVVAAYQGRGVLDESLTIEVTPDPDGRFLLPGMTPGRYLVQAARDGIWLSTPVIQTVEAGQTPPALTLDIPEPGEPVELEIIDAAGLPFVSQSITLNRPQGPLSSLWPARLLTDERGHVVLRSLEAGSHSFSLNGKTERASIRVSEAREDSGPPVVKRLILQRPGP